MSLLEMIAVLGNAWILPVDGGSDYMRWGNGRGSGDGSSLIDADGWGDSQWATGGNGRGEGKLIRSPSSLG